MKRDEAKARLASGEHAKKGENYCVGCWDRMAIGADITDKPSAPALNVWVAVMGAGGPYPLRMGLEYEFSARASASDFTSLPALTGDCRYGGS